MPRRTDFPPKFNRSLPAVSDEPLASFFINVRKFLNRPKRLDYSVSENVKTFNESLTRAIHEDVSYAKMRLTEIRSAFESVEKALELQDDIYEFFDEFDKFTYICLSRKFKWDMFQDYVRAIKMRIGEFQELHRLSCRPLKAPFTWPTPNHIKDVNVARNMNKKFNKEWLEIDGQVLTNQQMKTRAITNFKLAIELANILDHEVICPLFDKLLDWLTENKINLHLYKELETLKGQFVTKMKTQKAEYVEEIDDLKKRKTWRHHDLEMVAKRSIETVSTAERYYPELVANHRRMFQISLFGLYDQYLKLLKNFKSNLETIGLVSQDAKTTSECNKAKDACRVWMHALVSSRNLLRKHPLEHVPKYLTKLPNFIANFTFKYHSL